MEALTQEMKDVFQQVLDGASFVDAAQQVGWSKRTTQDRVKRLARELQSIVGVEQVDDHAPPSLTLLRTHRAGYLEALEHYVPERALTRRGHRAATADDLERILGAIMRNRRCRERDRAMVLTLFATGAKPAEIAGFEVRDYLDADGAVRTGSVLRAEIAFNARERPLYFVNGRACEAIDAYLAYRLAAEQGVANPVRYRGLDPYTPLFLRQDGRPFGADPVTGATTVQNLYHRLLKAGGVDDLSTLSARRGVAVHLRRAGRDLDEIKLILGLTSKDSARRLLQPDPRPLHEAMQAMI